jgi:hypothetical protein
LLIHGMDSKVLAWLQRLKFSLTLVMYPMDKDGVGNSSSLHAVPPAHALPVA